MQMNGLAELHHHQALRRPWRDPRLISACCTTTTSTRSRGRWGDGRRPEVRGVADACPNVDYARFALWLGLTAITVDRPGRRGPAWDAALAADRPAVLDIRCDPEVPPIPPHAEFEQVKSETEAMLKGDPGAMHLVAQGIKTKIQELLPGRG